MSRHQQRYEALQILDQLSEIEQNRLLKMARLIDKTEQNTRTTLETKTVGYHSASQTLAPIMKGIAVIIAACVAAIPASIYIRKQFLTLL